jgi:hypothetical protein
VKKENTGGGGADMQVGTKFLLANLKITNQSGILNTVRAIILRNIFETQLQKRSGGMGYVNDSEDLAGGLWSEKLDCICFANIFKTIFHCFKITYV